MKADDLEFNELINIAEGNISLHGRRLELHSINAFGRFRKDIIEMLGKEQTRRLFTRFGYFWGQADAAALQRIYKWESPAEWLKASVRMHSMAGAVRASVREYEYDEGTGRFFMDCSWYDSGEAEEHLVETGLSKEPVCWKMTGYASGYASYCLGKNIYFVEQLCNARGDRFCQAIGQDEASWGDEIKPHLPFFQADDIKGTVEHLTRELRQKSAELNRQRKQIDLLRHKSVPFFVEGRSRMMQQVLDLAGQVAPFDSSVLITGETGVGKEVLARYLHTMSQRESGPFLAVNCGALPETLLESELFGYTRGSFTGAVRDRVGIFEEAGGGTIFLDEIGDISLSTQMKILRVLQEREITRIGENTPRKINVRIIAATNRDIDKAVEENDFRDDLLYRLRVIEIEIPPLRDRPEDVLPLARFILERMSKKLNIEKLKLHPDCADNLLAYHWPGNVRELENALERAAVLSHGGIVYQESLPRKVREGTARAAVIPGVGLSLRELEDAYIKKVLESTGGNRTRAAKILGIGGATLWRKLKAKES